MTRLDPAISVYDLAELQDVDARPKAGHDDAFDAWPRPG
jgi:hypothetical protein